MSNVTKDARHGGVSLNVVLTATVVLFAVLVIGGVLLVGSGDGDESAMENDETVPEEVLHPEGSHSLTEAGDARVTVVEFLDYQCPACAQFYEGITRDIERDYDGEITFVTRNLPLKMHPLAVPAARAAEAAAMQGEYEAMYHALFDNYTSWAKTEGGQQPSDDQEQAHEHFEEYAAEIGLDLEQFRTDMASQQVTRRIEQDRSDAEQVGATGTPTFFINGQRFTPEGETLEAIDRQFRDRIDQELDQ